MSEAPNPNIQLSMNLQRSNSKRVRHCDFVLAFEGSLDVGGWNLELPQV